MSALVTLLLWSTGSSAAAPHLVARAAIEAAIDGQQITNLVEVEAIAERPPARNIGAMAWGALCYSGHASWSDFGRFLETPSEEQNSHFYSSWTLGALLLGAGQHETIDQVLMAELAWSALTVRPWRSLRVITPRGDHRRDRNHGLAFDGPAFASAGNRYLWRISDARYPERNLVAVVLHLIRGSRIHSDFLHPEIRFVTKAARLRHWERLPAEFLSAVKTESVVRLVEALAPVPQRRAWQVIRYADGSQVTVLEASTAHTRGPVNATLFDAASRVLTLLSASSDTGKAGVWTRGTGRIDGQKVVVESADKKIARPLPKVPVAYHIVWDQEGARQTGGLPSKL